MHLECYQDGDGMQVTARLSGADLARLDEIFGVIRHWLEIDAPRACTPQKVEGPAASAGDMPEGREQSSS